MKTGNACSHVIQRPGRHEPHRKDRTEDLRDEKNDSHGDCRAVATDNILNRSSLLSQQHVPEGHVRLCTHKYYTICPPRPKGELDRSVELQMSRHVTKPLHTEDWRGFWHHKVDPVPLKHLSERAQGCRKNLLLVLTSAW